MYLVALIGDNAQESNPMKSNRRLVFEERGPWQTLESNPSHVGALTTSSPPHVPVLMQIFAGYVSYTSGHLHDRVEGKENNFI